MTIDAKAVQLESGSGHGRYFYAFSDGSEAELSYVENRPGIVTITHTYTPPKHRGQGTAAALVARAVSDFRAGGQKVIPACSFARQEFRAHPDWADLLHATDGTRQ